MFGGFGYGAGAFGTATAGSRTFTFNASFVPQDGGIEVTFTAGLDAGVYQVHFGPNLSTADPLCYSGVSGSGYNVTTDPLLTTFWIPPNPIGSSGFYFVRVTGSGATTISTGLVTQVVGFPYRSQMLSYRSLFPPRWKLGHRGPQDLPLQV